MKVFACGATVAAALAAMSVQAQSGSANGWREVARAPATTASSTATLPVSMTQRFRDVAICAEGGSLHLRRVEVRMDGRVWQRIDVPPVMQQGQCTDPVNLRGGNRRIHVVRFEFDNAAPGAGPATAVARARGRS